LEVPCSDIKQYVNGTDRVIVDGTVVVDYIIGVNGARVGDGAWVVDGVEVRDVAVVDDGTVVAETEIIGDGNSWRNGKCNTRINSPSLTRRNDLVCRYRCIYFKCHRGSMCILR